MIPDSEIAQLCTELGLQPPRIVPYANCTAVIIRNGDAEKVLIVIDESLSIDAVKHKIAAAFKVKAENLPSDAKLAKLAEPDPVTPAKEIRAHQESKKHVPSGRK